MNYKDLPKNTKLFEYVSLNKYSKDKAFSNVLNHEIKVRVYKIEIAKRLIKENIHTCINDKYFISRLKKRKYLKNFSTLEKTIIGNLLQFTKEGEYITFYN